MYWESNLKREKVFSCVQLYHQLACVFCHSGCGCKVRGNQLQEDV